MLYNIKIVFNDANELGVTIPAFEYDGFLSSLKSGDVFWNESKREAFWTNWQNIRYMKIDAAELPVASEAPVEVVETPPCVECTVE